MVAVLGGVAAAAGSWSNPQVKPVVLLLTNPSEIVCGVYVSESSDGVYVGEPVLEPNNGDLGDHKRGSVVEVSRARVTALVVGSSQPLAEGVTREYELADKFTVMSNVPTFGCASLGFTVHNGPGGLRVQRVTQDDAAEMAGLRRGNVIVKVDGRRASRAVLRAVTARKEPGETVALRMKDGRTLNVQVPREPSGLLP